MNKICVPMLYYLKTFITLQRLTCKGDIQPKHRQDKQTKSEIHLTINLKH